MLIHKIMLDSLKCAAAKNAIKTGDILLSVNENELPLNGDLEESKLFIQNVLDDACLYSTMRLLINRGENNINFAIKTKNHGIVIETFDSNEIEKEKQRKLELERVAELELERAAEIERDIKKQIKNYKIKNKNKTIIVHSPYLRNFFVCQYSPKEPTDKSFIEQVSDVISCKKSLMLINYKDTEFEVAFETLADDEAKFGIQFCKNKMLSSGYIDLKEENIVDEKKQKVDFNFDLPDFSFLLYVLAFLAAFSGLILSLLGDGEISFLFLISGIITAIFYVWFGKVISYLDALKKILLQK